METWKEITNVQALKCQYFVSDLGRVMAVNGTTTTVKLGFNQPNGYLCVTFGHKDRRNVHALVGEYFCEKPEGSECLNHLNGKKHDNRAVNLKWVTYAENNRHAFESGLNLSFGENHARSIDKEIVYYIYELKKQGKKVHEIAKLVNVGYDTLKCIYSGKNWKYEYQKYFGESFKKSGRGGAVSWNAISEQKVLEIYRMKKEGKGISEIVKVVNEKYHTVKHIFSGKNWKHLYKEHFPDVL